MAKTYFPDLKMLKQADKQSMMIKGSVLLCIYLVIPLCFLIQIIDYAFLNWQLRDSILPKNPESLLIWNIFFVFPHIVSSLITLADREYITFYKKRFSRAVLVISIIVFTFNFIVPLLFTPSGNIALNRVFVVILTFVTMYHALSQQLGISMNLMKLKTTGVQYELWRWANALAGTVLYIMAFAGSELNDTQLYGNNLYEICRDIVLFLIVIANIQGIFMAFQAHTRIGVYYTFANIIMLVSMFIMMELEYSFLAIVIPRVIHDMTAFVVYSVHDRNRNLIEQHNYFYRLFAFLKISPLILCIILAVLFGQLIQCGSFYVDAWLGFQPVSMCISQAVYQPEIKNTIDYQAMQIWVQISLIAALFHYYAEAIIWKKDSPHRHYVGFK